MHKHRDVQDGTARAAVFGISDGLVSNVSLILGIAGASTDPSIIRIAGISGLLAGAVSMAAGEYVSLQAQKELVERELLIERKSIDTNLEDETEELKAIYEERGLDPDLAEEVARQIMANSEIALEVHIREELGVNPEQLGSPILAAGSSFVSFSFGAFVPLVPWLLGEGNAAIWVSAISGIMCTALVGGVLARLSGRSIIKTSLRQMSV
ncbi:MAG: VIT1/CCC1 transporter family protein, partial [Acidimicrobiales bacterium]|nr:VIT1/CCC1 transporter family protein [Acidimicrobiales bacterium]